MLAAEAAYCAMEDGLRDYLDNYESTHDYDEYRYELDDIEHDPYVLISAVTALMGREWTLSEVGGILDMLFEKQYILTETVTTETRYRTETRTGYYTDAEGNLHSYEYTVQVPYTYYICTCLLYTSFKEKIFCLRTEISRRIQEVRQAEQTTSQSRTSENVPPMKWSKK